MHSPRKESTKAPSLRMETLKKKPRSINYIIVEDTIPEVEKCLLLKAILEEQPALSSQRHSMFSGESNLHLAVKKNLVKVAALFIEHGADVNALDDHRQKPFYYAQKNNYLEIARLLIQSGAIIQHSEALQFLVQALENQHIDLAILLIQTGMDLNQTDFSNRTPLYHAAKLGLHKVLSWLFYYGADLTIGENPLKQAIINNHPQSTARLISLAKPEQAAFVRASKKYVGKLPPEASQAMMAVFSTPARSLDLHALVKGNAWEAVMQYVEDGLPLNVRDADNCTPIHYAAQPGFSQILLLLSRQPGIEFNILDKRNESLLHKCVKNRDINGVKIVMTAPQAINRYCRNIDGKRAEDLIDSRDRSKEAEELRAAMIYLPAKKRGEDYKSAFYKPHQIEGKKLENRESLLKEFGLLKLEKLGEKPVSQTPVIVTGISEAAKNAKADFDANIAKIQEELENTLIDYGLDTVFPASQNTVLSEAEFLKISREGKVSIESLKIIYGLCSGDKIENSFTLNMQSLYYGSIGLLNYYPPAAIIRGLILLTSYFSNYQHLTGHYLVFTLLKTAQALNYLYLDTQDRLIERSGSELEDTIIEEDLKTYIRQCCLQNIAVLFRKTLDALKVLNSTKAYTAFIAESLLEKPLQPQQNINDRIQKIINEKNKISLQNIKYIAEEISQSSIGFFQKKSFGILTGNEQKKLSQSEMSNILPAYIVKLILEQKTPKLRARAIALFAFVARHCFHVNFGPDLNSAIMIITALSSPRIDRLKNTLACLSKKNPKAYELYQVLITWPNTDIQHNYKWTRTFIEMYPAAIASTGFYRREQTLITENSTNKAENILFLGQLHHQLITIRENITFFQCSNNSDLSEELMQFTIPDEDALIKMSWLAEPRYADLSEGCSIEDFESSLKRAREYEIPLRVIAHSKTYEGKNALPVIQHWLDKLRETHAIDEQKAKSLYNCCKSFIGDIRENSPLPRRSTFRSSFFGNNAVALSSNKVEETEKKSAMMEGSLG